jgi:hypothetical protein
MSEYKTKAFVFLGHLIELSAATDGKPFWITERAKPLQPEDSETRYYQWLGVSVVEHSYGDTKQVVKGVQFFFLFWTMIVARLEARSSTD